MQMMLEVAMGVMDMEDDKVTDVVLRIPNEDFTDGTVVTDDIKSKGSNTNTKKNTNSVVFF